MKRFAIIIAGIILAINCIAQINIWANTECHKKSEADPIYHRW